MQILCFRPMSSNCAAIGILLACLSSAEAQTTVKIGLAVPNFGAFAPVYAAEELGYYKANGLTAEITAYRGGARGAGGARGRSRRHHQFLSARRGAGGEERHQGKDRRHRIGAYPRAGQSS